MVPIRLRSRATTLPELDGASGLHSGGLDVGGSLLTSHLTQQTSTASNGVITAVKSWRQWRRQL